jgi:hypothetical protein
MLMSPGMDSRNCRNGSTVAALLCASAVRIVEGCPRAERRMLAEVVAPGVIVGWK